LGIAAILALGWKVLVQLSVRLSAGFVGARFRFKDRFNRLWEKPRDTEGERQAGVVFSCLDCVHRLPRHMEARRQVRLRPGALCSKNSEPVLHG